MRVDDDAAQTSREDARRAARPVLVTGANGGIGSGIVRSLLAHGYRNVACHYHTRKDRVEAVLTEYGLPPDVHTFEADLTREDDVAAMHAAFAARFGAFWGVVNVAGASSNAMTWRMPLAEFRRIVDASLVSTFLCTRQYAPEMRERGAGRIINVSSVVAETGVAGVSHYGAAKAAVIGFTKSAAIELAPRGVTVNALALGYVEVGLIDTIPADIQQRLLDTIPAKRFGRVDEVAALVRYLLGDESAYATGHTFRLNGGLDR